MRQPPMAYELSSDWGSVLPFVGYDMDKPTLWEKYGSEWVEFPHNIGDPYLMLNAYKQQRENMPAELAPNAFALFTVGYAAPIDDCSGDNEGARPSESPNRERVAVGVFMAKDATQASQIRFQNPDRETVTEAYGAGFLAEALDAAAFTCWGVEYIARLTLILTDLENNLSDDVRANLRDRVSLLIDNYQAEKGEEEDENE